MTLAERILAEIDRRMLGFPNRPTLKALRRAVLALDNLEAEAIDVAVNALVAIAMSDIARELGVTDDNDVG